MKAFLMSAGSKRVPTTFLLNDNQILNEKMLEDLNNILNSGHVPNIYEPSELEEMNVQAKKDCQLKGLEQSPVNLYNQ